MAVISGEYNPQKISSLSRFGGISEAHELLENVQDEFVKLDDASLRDSLGKDDDGSLSSGERYVAISELVEPLEKAGLFYVRFRPDFSSVYKDVLRNPVRKTLKSGIVKEFEPQKVGILGRRTTNRLKTNLIEKMLEDVSRRKVANKRLLKGRWYIDVGFLDPARRHVGAASNISFAQLIMFLLPLGYDPLLPIRKSAFIKSVECRMAKILVNARNEYVLHKKNVNVRSELEKVGRQVCYFVKDYISGGQKPALDRSTITVRRSRQKDNSSLYPEGIEEPLVETGDLVADVWYRVIGENTYVASRLEIEEEEKIKAEIKKSNASAKTVPTWIKHKEVALTGKVKVEHSIKETQEELNKIAIAQKLEREALSSGMRIRSGLFKGQNPNEQQDAITIMRMYIDIYRGKNAFVTKDKLTPSDTSAFNAAKEFMKKVAANIGVDFREYVGRFGIK